jgi:hypothetical protein
MILPEDEHTNEKEKYYMSTNMYILKALVRNSA